MTTAPRYPLHRPDQPVPASPDLPGLEREVLAHWDADGTFQASIDQRDAGENGSNEFVFYDGPPFANGLPHYGHLLTGYAKDVVPRYQTMKGRRVERRFGWDTHGLPAELEAQRLLGITEKAQIDELGIAKFNQACRESVLRYTGEWREYVTRQARWVDFDHDYKTLDVTFMESVIWAFKQLHDKGLAYEGYRVLPYCWVDETPLSNHELRMDDDVYASRQDPALTVGLRLESGELALIWTTTPWTLPSNLAVAVGADVEYVVAEPAADSPFGQAHPGERVVLAAARLAAYQRELGEATVVETLTGAQLAGRRYTPPFDYFAGHENAHQVLTADFVTTDDGSGIVHLAPAFGEDDMVACDAAGIAPVVPVDARGRFTAEVGDYADQQVFEANKPIIADLKGGTGPLARVAADRRAVVVRHETYEHSYPHCWRCRNPLIYKAVSSWFVRVTEFRDRMVELNQEITWTPEHIRDGQFGKWLAGARDWSISRNRYWGTPIPVWVSDDPLHPRVDVYGSLAELEADFGRLPTNEAGEPDLHRPFIDDLTRPNPDDPSGKSTMRRIPDVLDVWFDSGAMPFAQVHYPFENADWFEHHYPGDFIVEYIGQTRGWFYTLHVLATAIFDRPAFRNVMCHGIVLGDDGRKASKSLRNFPDPVLMWDKYGSDAVRWSLMSSPILRGGNLVVTEEGIRDGVRQVLLPLWSTYYFFTLYAGAARGGAGLSAQRVDEREAEGLATMDRYLLARTRWLVADVTKHLDAYDVAEACEAVRDHLDLVTNWYVRTQRQRFWDEDQAAFDTLWTALEVLTRVMAPLAPLVTEEIWRGLTGGRSVHLTDWPTPGELVATDAGAAGTEAELVAAMDRVREVVSVTLGLRKARQLRVRQPLRELRVVVPHPEWFGPFLDLVASEVNVRHVRVLGLHDADAADLGVSAQLAVNARAAGPRLGRAVQSVIKAAKAGAWEQTVDGVVVRTDDGDVALQEHEYTVATVVEQREGVELAAGVLSGDGFVVLDVALDDELLAEGYARDVVRQVQDARKAAGLHVGDRVLLTLDVPRDHVAAVEAHRETIAHETLAVSVTVNPVPGPEVAVHVAAVEAGGYEA
ncbi:isoleucine--tRNA ligase [Cellulomonas fimi]|uniref:Isoleucine--tRNA ligase n=1 Tax=Cellulomonas fimi (strain ATCC 484 / DSM 20113 / JCM 1341 / CCUG 24087 / LMG 16345 / NBRC 15513 / NCIMB 8980 / NCTC 7547 / NRS-133) TaxID=590998 RepID=F4H6I5_CELFA|nr:isoleucine--tRNA ligase [Cellulomonas fimi]AEE45618.1 isoleucyl-tRNA synthetase [Cellulomonas fimi ATCC 484]NNH05875.1 isoleucine--tRNA ligase [Cellulomonas fimi]VEH30087.1 Isoleucine--tRNA ligase [Cellulomonas fimi]